MLSATGYDSLSTCRSLNDHRFVHISRLVWNARTRSMQCFISTSARRNFPSMASNVSSLRVHRANIVSIEQCFCLLTIGLGCCEKFNCYFIFKFNLNLYSKIKSLVVSGEAILSAESSVKLLGGRGSPGTLLGELTALPDP